MKRIMTILLLLLVVVLFLNGCSSTTPDAVEDQQKTAGTQDAQDSDLEIGTGENLQPPAFPGDA